MNTLVLGELADPFFEELGLWRSAWIPGTSYKHSHKVINKGPAIHARNKYSKKVANSADVLFAISWLVHKKSSDPVNNLFTKKIKWWI
jgi:hypothetical protein